MNRLKYYLPQRILQILYNSLILSHLNSNITAWGLVLRRTNCADFKNGH